MTLYEYRVKKRLSQAELARLIGYTQGGVSKLEAKGCTVDIKKTGHIIRGPDERIIVRF